MNIHHHYINPSARMIRRLLGDKIATITFKKLDGSTRVLNGRLGVTKNVKGVINTNPNNVRIYEVSKENGEVKGFRTIIPENVMEIVCKHEIHKFLKGMR